MIPILIFLLCNCASVLSDWGYGMNSFSLLVVGNKYLIAMICQCIKKLCITSTDVNEFVYLCFLMIRVCCLLLSFFALVLIVALADDGKLTINNHF